MRSNRGFTINAIWFLIGVNFLLFIATSISEELIVTLELQRASFTGEPWTIVTSMFIHSGLWHIAANMLTLYFFGTYLYRLIGEKNFIALYFLGGLLGNALFMLLGDHYSIVIGASGAVFAVGGALTVLRPNLKVLVFPIPVPIPLWTAVLGVFFIISFAPNVAWQAHLGGLLFGLTAGYSFKKGHRYFY